MDGQTIAGRYRLVTPIGRGAMSSVWLAEDSELARRVAVKILAPSADPERFEREARAVAALAHPNIAALYDYGAENGRPYMVLEYLPGGSLADRLRPDTPLADDETRTIAREVAAGLAHAHERGLVHRDLKPANILFDAEDRAKLVDFGIARVLDANTLTEAGTVLGTASTISPEQAAGESAGPASDVYSFGVILFRLLTGHLPFTAASALELVRLHRDELPLPVTSVRPDAPADLAALTDAALAKDPARRPPDGAALVQALESGAETAPRLPSAVEDATRVLTPVPTNRRPMRRVLALTALALALVGGGAAVAVLATGGGGDGTAPTGSDTGLGLPTVSTAETTTPATTAETTTTAPTTSAETTTTAPTTTAETTTAPATTAETTTTAPATTAETTTAPATTAETTTAATTTAVTTTTASTTTAAETTTAETTTGP